MHLSTEFETSHQGAPNEGAEVPETAPMLSTAPDTLGASAGWDLPAEGVGQACNAPETALEMPASVPASVSARRTGLGSQE
jgi:hypothetical protein